MLLVQGHMSLCEDWGASIKKGIFMELQRLWNRWDLNITPETWIYTKTRKRNKWIGWSLLLISTLKRCLEILKLMCETDITVWNLRNLPVHILKPILLGNVETYASRRGWAPRSIESYWIIVFGPIEWCFCFASTHIHSFRSSKGISKGSCFEAGLMDFSPWNLFSPTNGSLAGPHQL